MKKIKSNILLICCLIVLLPQCKEQDQPEIKPNASVIYSSDFAVPHGDPDDHFDILSLFSCKNVDIKAVILDHPNAIPGRQPNFEGVRKVTELFNRSEVPTETGLRFVKLKSPTDQGYDRPKENQKAVELIISTLKQSQDKSITIITVGGLRDIAAAYNREPVLFKEKIERFILSVGDSYGMCGMDDTNTRRDEEAWKCIMTSGLPIYWMPTNPSKWRGGPSRFVSYWYFIQSEIEPLVPEKVKQFLLSEDIDLSEQTKRHMWSTPAFIESAGFKCYQIDGEIKWMLPEEAKNTPRAQICHPYEFVPIKFSLDESGVAVWEEAKPTEDVNVHIFKINDYYLYNEAMFQFLVGQFNSLPEAK